MLRRIESAAPELQLGDVLYSDADFGMCVYLEVGTSGPRVKPASVGNAGSLGSAWIEVISIAAFVETEAGSAILPVLVDGKECAPTAARLYEMADLPGYLTFGFGSALIFLPMDAKLPLVYIGGGP